MSCKDLKTTYTNNVNTEIIKNSAIVMCVPIFLFLLYNKDIIGVAVNLIKFSQKLVKFQ
jgi:uncharacterized membrane protein SpoIIM required for sporulation